jgi:hypothetical protein
MYFQGKNILKNNRNHLRTCLLPKNYPQDSLLKQN